jgi:prepilin-type processing-associated H-X9-DG protein/prepilin-type N-terminal cleavage/methylation domain-containing protein
MNTVNEKRKANAALFRFTLIELLVVIAIIAILAGILMPALSQARERGRSATCVNNQKNVMLALNQYSEDYNGWMYSAYKDYSKITDFTYDPDTKGTHNWSARLVNKKYIADGNRINSALFCPSSSQTIPDTTPEMVCKYSYGMSYATAYPTKTNNYFAHNTRLKHIPRLASKMLVLADSADPVKHVPSHLIHHKYDSGKVDHGLPFYLHNGRANVAYMDGHCSTTIPYETLYLLRIMSGGNHYRTEAGLLGTPGATEPVTWKVSNAVTPDLK